MTVLNILLKMKKLSSLIDTSINSFINAVLAIAIINLFGEVDYGEYVIYFATYTLVLSIVNAIISNQLLVFISKEIGFSDYTTEYSLLLLGIVVLCILSFSSGIVLSFFFQKNNILILSFFFFSLTFKEIIRSWCYLLGKHFFSNCLHFLLLLVLSVIYAALYFSSIDIVLDYLLICISISYLALSVIISLIVIFSEKRIILLDIDILSRSWKVSKWSLFSGTTTWGQNNLFTYIATAYYGVVGAATLASTRLLMMPINLLSSGIYSGMKPQWSREIKLSRANVKKNIYSIGFAISFVSILYGVIIYIYWDIICKYLFANKFTEHGALVLLWSTFFSIQSLRVAVTNILQTELLFKQISKVGIPITITCIVTMASIGWFSLPSIIVIMIIFELLLLTILYKKVK